MALPTGTTSVAGNASTGTLNDLSLQNLRKLGDGPVGQVHVIHYDNAYCPISTATTTVVKTGAGQLHSIMVLGGTLGAVTVYDNTAASGNVIAPTFTPATLAGGGPGVYTFDVEFATGLTIVTAAATAITVTFK